MRRELVVRAVVLAVLPCLGAAVGCSAIEERAYVQIPPPVAPTPDVEVGRATGDLLANEPARSREGERALLALDERGLAALGRLAGKLPRERDPRWLHVLDEHRLLPPLTPAERTAFLAWKAARPETSFAMKARAALADQARDDPQPLYDVLTAGGPGVEQVAVALAVSGRREAAARILARYVESDDERERRALAQAAATLTGAERPPRVNAPKEERVAEARRVLLALAPGGARE